VQEVDDRATEAILMATHPDMHTFCLGFCQDYWQARKGWRKLTGLFHCLACLHRWGLVSRWEGFPPKYRPRPPSE
jgi:hypothetical protein